MSKYLVYVVNIAHIKDKSRRIYVSFGDVYLEIEFTEACSSKLVISLRRVDILRTWRRHVEDDMAKISHVTDS